jgi:hypothetical protein
VTFRANNSEFIVSPADKLIEPILPCWEFLELSGSVANELSAFGS